MGHDDRREGRDRAGIDGPLLACTSATMPSTACDTNTTAPRRARELDFGDIAGDYRVTVALGEGGLGLVYRALHRHHHYPAALKVTKHSTLEDFPDADRLLLGEARLLSRISHHGVAKALDAGRCADGRIFVAMELIDGPSLTELMESAPLPRRQVLAVATQLTEALAAIHTAGVAHLDVTPRNIIMRETRGAARPVLIDFGNSRLLSNSQREDEIVTGTPHYMSPEQARGRGIDHRSDIYSLGAVLYEMIAGEPVFDGETPREVALHHVRTPAPRVEGQSWPVSPRLRAIVTRCLAKNPRDRFQTADQLATALRELRQQRHARKQEHSRPMRPRCRRGRLAKLLGIGAALLCLAGGTAHADSNWELTLEAPAAVPVSWPQVQWFSPGLMPAVTTTRTVHRHFGFGARLRAGVLGDGEAPRPELMDYGMGGLGELAGVVRWSPRGTSTGLWVDASLGVAVTGSLTRPVAEVGVGWNGWAGHTRISPVLRYLHVQDTHASAIPASSARLALVGLQITFGGSPPRHHQRLAVADTPGRRPVVHPPAPKPAPRAAPPPTIDECTTPGGWKRCPDRDFDSDGIINVADECPTRAEIVNGVDDADGCPDKGVIRVVRDRVTLDSRVLFDLERSRVKSRGRHLLRAVARMWKQHPEWSELIVEGHTCQLGDEEYNLQLSRRRARNVRRYLIRRGVPADAIRSRGLGESRPLVRSGSRRRLRLNRRVEIVIVKRKTEIRGKRIDAPGAVAPSSAGGNR
jgi:outer membrane protein OmpA-like peptidoglycan-associated protein/predicted Ser/Thr protein kinase